MSQPAAHYILVDASMRPVPLPFATVDFRGDPVTVTSFEPSAFQGTSGLIMVLDDLDRTPNREPFPCHPSVCNLSLVTEDEFQAAQHPRAKS